MKAIIKYSLFTMHMYLLTFATYALADVILPNIDTKFVQFKEINPTRDAGYVVGDKLERTLILTVKKPYELIHESLPIVGYEHRYRGQVSGIELTSIHTEDSIHSDESTFTIHLVYQVFKSGRVAKPAILRGEIVKLRKAGSSEMRQFQFPSFNFRTSPLSVYGEVNLKNEMSPFIPPLTLDTNKQKSIFNIATFILGLSLLGLVYILGAYTWLPKMGGPFAKTYRKIRKLPDDQHGIEQSINLLHQAIQTVAGHSVFANSIDVFLQEKPSYSVVKPEIERFFDLSRKVYFDASIQIDLGIPTTQWLKNFCRHMRDCERGLSPEVGV